MPHKKVLCTDTSAKHYPYKIRTGKKKALSREAKCLIFLVGGASFELATPAV
jgi:hypothetical protein